MKKNKIYLTLFILLVANFSFSQNVWTGATSDSWTIATNWSLGYVPTASDDVIIPDVSGVNNPDQASSPMNCRELTIQPGGVLITKNQLNCTKLTIKAGGQLTIQDPMFVSGDMLIESPAGNGIAGSFLERGTDIVTVGGTITVQRGYTANSKWQFVSSPLKGQTSELFTNSDAEFNLDFMRYNESYDCLVDPVAGSAVELYEQWTTTDLVNAWENHHNGDGGATEPLGEGIGYALYNDADMIVNYVGTTADLSRGDIFVPLTFTANDGNSNFFDGWNLIGNPFPSSYRFDNRNLAGDVERSVYLWDGATENYQYFNYSGNATFPTGTQSDIASYVVNGEVNDAAYQYIPAGQAFFVKAVSAGSFMFKETNRKHNESEMFRNATVDRSESSIEFIKLRIESGSFSDETVIRFIDDASVGHDGDYDTYKLNAQNLEVPQIYSYSETSFSPWAINSLPGDIDVSYTVPLAFRFPFSGKISLKISDFQLSSTNAILEDTQENIFVDLNSNNAYDFWQDGGTDENRFKIHMTKTTTGINRNLKSLSLNVFPNPSKGFIIYKTEQSLEILGISLKGISGKEVFQQSGSIDNFGKIDLSNCKPGIYFLSIQTDKEVFTEKIILQN